MISDAVQYWLLSAENHRERFSKSLDFVKQGRLASPFWQWSSLDPSPVLIGFNVSNKIGITGAKLRISCVC